MYMYVFDMFMTMFQINICYGEITVPAAGLEILECHLIIVHDKQSGSLIGPCVTASKAGASLLRTKA